MQSIRILKYFRRTNSFLYQYLAKQSSTVSTEFKGNSENIPKNVQQRIRDLLTCSIDTARKIYDEFPIIRLPDRLERIKASIDFLMENRVSKETIIENPFLLVEDLHIMQKKLKLLQQLKPREIDDLIPLLEMDYDQLAAVAARATKERSTLANSNRIYYLSNKLKIQPKIVAKFVAKDTYVLISSLSNVQKKLKILLDYNVAPQQILNSLYVFWSADKILLIRLERMRANGITNFNFPVFKLTEKEFDSYIEHHNSQEEFKFPSGQTATQTKRMEKAGLLERIQTILACDNEKAATIYYNQLFSLEQIDRAKEVIDYLTAKNVKLKTIASNAFLLLKPIDEIEQSLNIVLRMQPKNCDDFIPLLSIELSELEKIEEKWRTEHSTIPGGHRIYYFSERMNVDTEYVSKQFAQHRFMFFRDFGMLRETVDLLLSHNMEPTAILSAMTLFLRSNPTIQRICLQMKSHNIANIPPWLLCCSDDRINLFMARQIEEMSALDGCKDIDEYLVKRLKWNQTTLNYWKVKYPALFKCSVSKVEKILNYLLTDVGFTVDDINNHLYVFRSNAEELKMRVNELKSLNVSPIRLSVVSLRKKDYLKYIKTVCVERNDNANMKICEAIEIRLQKKSAA